MTTGLTRTGSALLLTLVVSAAAPGQVARLLVNPEDPEVPALLPTVEQVEQAVVSDRVRRLVEMLESADFLIRESAMSGLRSDETPLVELCRVLSGEATAEQRYRLLAIIHDRLVMTPRGALGIQMGMIQGEGNEPTGVEIRDLIPGFPAEDVLQRRDRITHIDGHPLQRQQDLIVLVQSKKPGDEIDLRVARPRRDIDGLFIRDDDDHIIFDPVDVKMKLGSLEKLRSPNTGLAARNNDVNKSRQRESREAAARYRPTPRPVQVEVHPGSKLIEPELTELKVSEHGLIQDRIRQLDLVRKGQMTLTPEMLDHWSVQEATLEQSLLDPNLTLREGDYLRQVLEELRSMTGN